MPDQEFQRISQKIEELSFQNSKLRKLQLLLVELASRLSEASPSLHGCSDPKKLNTEIQELRKELAGLNLASAEMEKAKEALQNENNSLKQALVDVKRQEQSEDASHRLQLQSLSEKIVLLEQQLQAQEAPWSNLRRIYERSRFSVPCFGKIFLGDGFVDFVHQCAMEDRIRNLMGLVLVELQRDRRSGIVATELLAAMVAAYNRCHQSKLRLIEPKSGDPYDYDQHHKCDAAAPEHKVKLLLFPGLELPNGKIDKRAVVETE